MDHGVDVRIRCVDMQAPNPTIFGRREHYIVTKHHIKHAPYMLFHDRITKQMEAVVNIPKNVENATYCSF